MAEGGKTRNELHYGGVTSNDIQAADVSLGSSGAATTSTVEAKSDSENNVAEQEGSGDQKNPTRENSSSANNNQIVASSQQLPPQLKFYVSGSVARKKDTFRSRSRY